MNKDLLMTYEELVNRKWEVPYVYTVSSEDKHLYYFGARHSHDVHDPQFKQLKAFFIEFFAKTDPLKRIMIVEGGISQIRYKSPEDAASKDGEMQFAVSLANHENMKVISPDSDAKFVTRKVAEQFSYDEITYYIFARTCVQYLRVNPPERFEEYINIFLKKDIEEEAVKPYLFPNSTIPAIHKKIFQSELDTSDGVFFGKITNPKRTDSIINKVNQMASKIRDIAVLDAIQKEWEHGNSIFIVYGADHAVMQEPALKTLV